MKTIPLYIFLISLILFINCYEIESVDQSNSAEPNSSLDVPIVVSIWEETQGIKPNFGVRLPLGWSVQEPIQLEGAVKATLHYSPELSDSMQEIDPVPGYTWWIAEGEPVTAHEGRCSFVARIQTNDKTGVFFIDYVIGANGGFDNPYAGDGARSDGHLLSVGITRAEADLYISPAGDDNNSGLSFADPLKTITMGLAKIVADSLHPHTIHLANGIYSPSNGEYFPIRMPNYVSIAGESKEGVVLDGEHQNGLFLFDHRNNSFLANMTLKNCDNTHSVTSKFSSLTLTNVTICKNQAGGIYCDNSELTLKNVSLTENTAGSGAGIRCYNSTLTCENTVIAKNSGNGIYCENSTLTCVNTNIHENGSDETMGGGIYCNNSTVLLKNGSITNSTADNGGGICSERSDISMQNVLIEENRAAVVGGGIYCGRNTTLDLKNSTVRRNDAGRLGGGIYFTFFTKAFFDNSNRCNIYLNSAGNGGQDLWNKISRVMHVVVDTFTVLTPSDYHAFPLDKFTFDILNKPKSSTTVKDVNNLPKTFALRQNYPNPFNPTTTIEYDLPTASYVQLVIYDILGHRTRTLVDGQKQAGRFHIFWDSKDESGTSVAGGVYFCRMTTDEYDKVIKLVLVR